MSRIWAVARHTIAESIRTKTALVFMAMMVALLVILPFKFNGDGVTLQSRIQGVLDLSITGTSALLSIMTVFLACSCLANEIRLHQIYMIVTKPIPRWQFFLGKWLGISLLNFTLLLLAAITVWSFTWLYLRNLPTFEEDRMAVKYNVLTVRYGAKMEEPDFANQVEERFRTLREEGRLDNVNQSGQAELRSQIDADLRKSWRSLGPGEYKDFTFSNMLVDRSDEEGVLYMRFKPMSPSGADGAEFQAAWQAGDHNDKDTLGPVQTGSFRAERFHEVPIPAWTVNNENVLRLRIQNTSQRETILFEGADSFEVLFDIGTFHWNIARAFSIVWCRLAFLAVLGLLCSTFLSFPVACMGVFIVLFIASSTTFLGEAIEWFSPKPLEKGALAMLKTAFMYTVQGILWLIPDFGRYDPASTVVAGRVVPLKWVIESVVVLVAIKGFLMGLLGTVIFTRRELAQVTV
ncbi:MAG TPA: hypothetical protein PKY77_17325 [Phycisphaerae bacterium]|nr:hypothetical protein [Phycisphaerae bacterium]HRY70826.1 hypothetical protein [Phycisphaerae bacterium]HSA28331.1 hypothetical protein [Phycisphaerae bacterium]